MPDLIERSLETALINCYRVGEISIRRINSGGFILSHRDDEGRDDLQCFQNPEDAAEIARYDETGKYRPLKTAPNLRPGWRLELVDLSEVRRALDYFYPGRLAMFAAWKENRLTTTPLRKTLTRQSGMYRVASKISDEQINDLVGDFCRSNGGCLRTIFWKRDERGAVPSTRLPPDKFDASRDQALWPGSATPATTEHVIPLLCQEACSLLVAECRKVVKGKSALGL
ncbi:MAG TPA: DR2241 family protein [Chthoniobacterales bacterium]|jgi:sirohydrochlorin cobaltochelatase|nr:DR2241 family protein [Chthoniobacterales bacterium]